MPAKKRRRPTPAQRAAAKLAPAVAPAPETTARAKPATPGRGRPAGRPAVDEAKWSRLALFELLMLAFALQLVVGLITHLIGHRQRLLIIDLLFFQAPFVMAGCVLAAPLAKRLAHQPRGLRLLESLSLGAVFALLALLLTSVLVRGSNSASLTADQYIDRLTSGDALGIGVADVLAVLAAVQLFPGLQRILSAPGRRAQRRLLERRAAGQTKGATSAARDAKGGTRPRR